MREQVQTPSTLEAAMRIISVNLRNFGSYKNLDFDFENQGLTLIQGPTGSGKSTLMDAIPWILFGKTSKGGTIDEICSWNSTGSTSGDILLDSGITISRSRNPNDLVYIANNDTISRGANLVDTQRLINELLGVDYETYLSGAYFHEFSQTAQFFSTTAKNRRQICEQIVDLSLARKLANGIGDKTKQIGESVLETKSILLRTNGEIQTLENVSKNEEIRKKAWYENQEKIKKHVLNQYNQFEANRKRTISKKCTLCSTVLEHPHEVIDNSENPHKERLEQLNQETNPFKTSAKDYSDEILSKYAKLADYKRELSQLNDEKCDLDTLSDVTNAFRSTLIQNTIQYIESNTNELLARHFDSEIQVKFNATDNDKLEVTIHKDGNEASFTQLSKGQRQLLKLAFGVSVMKGISNHKGIHFSQIFFDEALDGLDEVLKIKAYDLLQEIAKNHESVFVVEHSEALKTMFDNKYSVSLENGNSIICQN